MRCKATMISCAILIASITATPASAQSGSVDPQFCDQANIKETAAKLTRDWAERYQRDLVEQVVQTGWTARGTVVQATNSGIICRIEFTNINTSVYPVRRLALDSLDFRYSETNGQAQLAPITLPMTGLDSRAALLATWERLFIDGKSYRAIAEEKAEHDPELAANLSALIGRPKGSENATWNPAPFCTKIGADAARAIIIDWAEKNNQVRATGLTAKETPRWLPSTGWTIGNFKVVSSIPFQSVICSADVSYTANTFDGKHIPMEIRGMAYKVWGNDDGSQIYTDVHNWPTEKEMKDDDDAFNRAWVVNGRTFEQDLAAMQQKEQARGGPKNIVEALAQTQAQANAEMEAIARAEGLPVDEVKKAEAEETRKYAEPCRMSGGTWGRPQDKYGNLGRLGCYHPTGER